MIPRFRAFDENKEKRVTRIFQGMLLLALLASAAPASAQQHSYSENTDNDGGEELYDCLPDVRRFCGGSTLLLFEMENCLQEHMGQLRPACRAHMAATDFRQYYQEEPHPGF